MTYIVWILLKEMLGCGEGCLGSSIYIPSQHAGIWNQNLEIDKDQVIRTLEDQWAVFLSDDILQAYFFINDNGQKLRLRKVGDTNILTYKEKISNENVMHNLEYEVEVSDFDTTVSLLTNVRIQKIWRIRWNKESLIS